MTHQQRPESKEPNPHIWSPSGAPKAVIGVLHGLSERAGRYTFFGECMAEQGIEVMVPDLPGHGASLGAVNPGVLEPGGWLQALHSTRAAFTEHRATRQGIPFFLLGQSWGSMLAQEYVQEWGGELQGAVFCSTNGSQPLHIRWFGLLLSRLESALRGRDRPSMILRAFTVRHYNSFFPRTLGTDYDWMNSDPAVVRAFVDDPLCAFPPSCGTAVELAKGVNRIARKERLSRIPRELPVLILYGEQDSSNDFGKGAEALASQYRELGLQEVDCRCYAETRHDLFNEPGRQQIFDDIAGWVLARVA